jgi:hypothetical protein
MTRRGHRLGALALALALPRLAAAEPHKLLVLQSEGRADARLRARIDAAIARLAIAAEPQAAPGELTFSDAATAVGCRPDAPSCKDDVLGMLAVDEIVITTVTPKPGGVEIAVHRVTHGGASRDATMLLATGAAPDRLDGIAPLFSGTPAAAPAPLFGPAPAAGPGSPAIATAQPGEPPATVPAPGAVVPPPQPVPVTTASEPPAAVDQPTDHNRRLELVGMAGGAGMVTLGLALWLGASSVQADIDAAPTRTQADLAHLRNLESTGDTYAAVGNVLVVTGAVVSGLATYLYLRDRRAASAATARLSPTVLDHGAGLVLTIGAIP